DRVIPFVVLEAVLPLGAYVGDVLADFVGLVPVPAVQVVASPARICRRPDVPGQQLQQQRFARAVLARQDPSLRRPDAPIEAAQDRATTERQAHIVQFYTKVSIPPPPRGARARTRVRQGLLRRHDPRWIGKS